MPKHETDAHPNRGIHPEGGRISKSQLRFFDVVNQLSEVKRQGWVDRGVENPESVTEHSFEVAVMTRIVAMSRGLDVQRAVDMAMFHDLAEVHTGDITPHQDLPESERVEAILYRYIPPTDQSIEQKRQNEENALLEIAKKSPMEVRALLVELWHEYREGQTEEAQLVHQMDRMQRLLQAKRYLDTEGEAFPIGSFLQEALASDDPQLRRLAREIRRDIDASVSS